MVRLDAAAPTHPHTLPGVLLGTITYDPARHHGTLHLALPPSIAHRDTVAAVIRIENSLDEAWATRTDAEIAADLGVRCDSLMAIVQRQSVVVAEVQLDYDAPVRRLERWARVAGRLRRGAFAGREVWVTSIVAHLREGAYGRWFQGEVAGHILQLFDTGEHADSAAAHEVEVVLARADLPFRLGVGAFERRHRDGSVTDHRYWFGVAPKLRQLAAWRGLWVFPGGQGWSELVEAAP